MNIRAALLATLSLAALVGFMALVAWQPLILPLILLTLTLVWAWWAVYEWFNR